MKIITLKRYATLLYSLPIWVVLETFRIGGWIFINENDLKTADERKVIENILERKLNQEWGDQNFYSSLIVASTIVYVIVFAMYASANGT